MRLSLAARLISTCLPHAFTVFVEAAILNQERPERPERFYSRQGHAIGCEASHQVSSDSQSVNRGNVRRSLMESCISDVSVVSE